MNYSVHDINLDIHDVNPQKTIRIKKNDTARRFNITLSEKGEPYHITEDCTATFTGTKPDGNKLFNPCTINGDTISYELTEQTSIVPGLLKAEIRLNGRGEEVITSPSFYVVVDDTLYTDGDLIGESSDETLALQDLMALVKETEEKLANGDFKGDKGDKGDTGQSGADGKDGVSCTHSWNGTTLSITSASGTTSANLKGDKGDKGDTGATGPQGPQGPAGSSASVSYPISVANGGTGSTSAATARTALGITPANIGAYPSTGGTVSGDLTTTGSIQCDGSFKVGKPTGGSSLEIFHASTPYIDFHHGGTTTDYTSRVIENASGRLSINGVNCISGGVVAAGKFRMNDGWAGMYPSANDAIANSNRYGFFGYDNGTSFQLYDSKDGILIRSAGPTKIGGTDAYKVGLMDAGAAWRPEKNGGATLGSANYKWGQIYSTASSISTSDRNEKENIQELNDKYIKLFDKLQPVAYEFIGEDHDRVHLGFISQDVKSAMDEAGLTDVDFAGYCRDKKIVPTFDENGNVIDEKEAVDENGNPEYIYSLRYAEFIALNTRMIQECRSQIKKQQEEIDTLKEAVARLTAALK